MDRIDERIIDIGLDETLGEGPPPDLKARILAAAEGSEARPQLSLLPGGGGRRRKLGIAIAAACVVIGFGMIWHPWSDDSTGGGDVHIRAEVPPGVHVTANARYRALGGSVAVSAGGVVLTPGAAALTVGGARIEKIEGYALAWAGGVPNEKQFQELKVMAISQGMEKAMFRKTRKWMQASGAALLVLTGSVVFNGTPVTAQDDGGAIEDAATEPAESALVKSVMDIEALPEDTIAVRGERLTDAHLEFLERFQRLERLDLRGNALITGAGLKFIANLESLKSVDLRGCALIKNEDLAILKGLPSLSRLGLNIPARLIKEVELKNGGKLQTYDIDAEKLQATLKEFSNLSSILLKAHYSLKGNSLEAIAGIDRLTDLDLSNTQISDMGLRPLKNHKSLVSLNLSFCSNITDAGLAYVAKIPSLKTLNLSRTYTTDAGLAQVGKMKGLKILNISRFQEIRQIKGTEYIIPKGLSHLAGLNNLEKLVFYPSPRTRRDRFKPEWLEELRALKNLRHLDIGGVPIDESVMEVLSELPRLEVLILNSVVFNRTAFEGFENLKSLKILRLSETRVNGAKLSNLSLELIAKCRSLEELSVEWGSIYTDGSNGPDVLFKPLASLKSLRLSRIDWFLSDGGGASDNDIHEAQKAIRESLPDCEVIFDNE